MLFKNPRNVVTSLDCMLIIRDVIHLDRRTGTFFLRRRGEYERHFSEIYYTLMAPSK
jgi:hypothetical protein